MAINGKPPHFVLLPFMAQGHLIPAVDIAKLLAKRGVDVSILVTPKNGDRVKKALDRAIASGLSIRVFHLRLPCAEAGLPDGCEFFDMLPSIHYVVNFFKATALLQGQVEQYLLQLNPTCLIADMCFPWASDVAQQLRIPRLVFHGTSCFSLLCMNMLHDSKFLQGLADREYFVVPDFPDKIEINKVQIRGSAQDSSPEWVEIRKQLYNSEENAAGTVANTFQELEMEYIRKYSNLKGKKVWCVGPVSLCNVEDSDKAERGSMAENGGNDDCLKWLDTHEAKSVVYVCLGSISCVGDAQLKEMGLGLEASKRPFVWVIRQVSDEFEAWVSEEKLEERIRGRGLLIRGWAPQMLILSHPSVGGFVTHCGWNSTLEGVSAGIPMATWPVFAEQFCNEKFIVSVIKTGVRVGVDIPVLLGVDEGAAPQVRSGDLKAAIDELMDGGKEGDARRERAPRLGEATKRAVEEGGSSHLSLTQLIQDMLVLKANYGGKSEYGKKSHELSSQICSPVK